MDFEKECLLFAMRQPFYGILLSAMERTPDNTGRVRTLGVSRSGNVFRLCYNPAFTKGLSTDTVQSLLLHEVLHLALNHFSLWEDSHHCDSHEWHLRNCAADLEVNSYLDRSKMDEKVGGLFAEDLGWERRLGAREYYKLLKSKEDQQREEARQRRKDSPAQEPDESKSGNNPRQENPSETPDEYQDESADDAPPQDSPHQEDDGSQGQGEDQDKAPDHDPPGIEDIQPLDDHSMWPQENDGSADIQEITQAIEELVSFAAEQVEKGHGTIPGEMTGLVDRIRRKPRPVTDWKRHFRRCLGNEFSDITRRSRRRLSRRYPDAPGRRHRRKSHILVAIDTSGSVSMKEYREFLGQIESLSRQATFHVLECDSKIQHEYDFNGTIPEVLHGGGGTDFAPAVDHFNQNRRKYDALVYFTDGYSQIPGDTPRETLWVISSDGQKDRQRYTRNGASVVFINN